MQSHYIRTRQKNKHLTGIERGKIEALRRQGWKAAAIAAEIAAGRTPGDGAGRQRDHERHDLAARQAAVRGQRQDARLVCCERPQGRARYGRRHQDDDPHRNSRSASGSRGSRTASIRSPSRRRAAAASRSTGSLRRQAARCRRQISRIRSGMSGIRSRFRTSRSKTAPVRSA